MPDLDAEELEEELEDERNFVPREMVGDSRHFTTCELDGADTVDRFLSCPVCLSIMRQPTATECLHRFCSECIETSIRIGKKECPSCRFPISTRRALRRDHNFEALMLTLFPDGMPEEDDTPVDLSQYQFKPLVARPPSPSEHVTETTAAQQRKAARARPALPSTPPADHDADADGGRVGMSEEKKRKPRERKPAPSHAPHADGGLENGYEVAEKPQKWSCPQCTLINSAQAKKCKVCNEPNPRVAATGGKAVEHDAAANDAFNDGTARRVGGKAKAPRGESSSAAKAAKAAAKAAKAAKAAAKRQKTEEKERAKAAKAEQTQRYVRKKEPEATNAVRPEPPLDLSEDAPSIEAQLFARQTYSLHIKSSDEGGVHILWCDSRPRVATLSLYCHAHLHSPCDAMPRALVLVPASRWQVFPDGQSRKLLRVGLARACRDGRRGERPHQVQADHQKQDVRRSQVRATPIAGLARASPGPFLRSRRHLCPRFFARGPEAAGHVRSNSALGADVGRCCPQSTGFRGPT